MKRITGIAICISSLIIFSCSKHEKREIKYPDGKLKEEFEVVETKNGSFMKDGIYKTWFADGQPEISTTYKNDTVDGHFIKWYENGQKQSEGEVKMGKSVGNWTSWFNDGKLNLVENYTADLHDGSYTQYFSNGKIYIQGNYKSGNQDGGWIFNREDGSLNEKGTYKNGKRDGTWLNYDEKGEVTMEQQFTDGANQSLVGKWKINGKDFFQYFPDGTCVDGHGKKSTYKINEGFLIIKDGWEYPRSYKVDKITLKEYRVHLEPGALNFFSKRIDYIAVKSN